MGGMSARDIEELQRQIANEESQSSNRSDSPHFRKEVESPNIGYKEESPF